MKFISVSRKLNYSILAISIIFLILAFIGLFSYSIKIKHKIYDEVKHELTDEIADKINAKMKIGITNAISIANDERIKKGLKTNSREEVIQSIQNVSKMMKENTEFKNIRIHIHTKDNYSFMRSWNKDQYGDDLSIFRKSVVEVNEKKKSLITFEAGKEGLRLRAIVPVFDELDNHLGSLEFIQGMNSVVKEFSEEDIEFLFLMNGNLNNYISFFKEEEKFKQYVISQEIINREFLAFANQIDLDKLLEKGYLTDSKYFYTFTEIKDFQNNNLGISIIAKPLNIVNETVNEAQTLIFIALGIIVIMIISICFTIMVLFKKLVNNPLKKFEMALNDFFLFLQSKKDYANDINIKTNDEFGLMADSLKQNIEYSAKLHEELYDLNINLEQKINEKIEKISILLNNAGQGFLIFKDDFKIDNEYSKECEKILGENIAFKDIREVLFNDEKKREFFSTTLINASNETMALKRNSYISLLPNIIVLNKKAIKLEYKIIDNKTFMLVLTNVTVQKKLENKIKKEQEIFKMIVAIASESAVFYDLASDYEKFVSNKIDTTDINELYRIIHTFKGSFSQLYMNEVVKILHSLETILSEMIKNDSKELLEEILEKFDFKSSYEETKRIISEILGDEFLEHNNYVKIDLSNIADLQHKITNVIGKEELLTPECHDILCGIKNLSNPTLYSLLKPYSSMIFKLASRFDKEIEELTIKGDKTLIVDSAVKSFIKSLGHVFRNCIDHGIENSEERVLKQKEEKGKIICQFKEKNNKLHIVISDDGMGLNSTKIREVAISKGIDVSSLNNEEIFKVIFNDNFSTKTTISEISGRGVGMSAVKNELEKLNGVVKITSQKNIGTTFEFIIPL